MLILIIDRFCPIPFHQLIPYGTYIKHGISDINSIMALMEAFMDESNEKDK